MSTQTDIRNDELRDELNESDERVSVQPPEDETPDYEEETTNRRDYESVIYDFDENSVSDPSLRMGKKRVSRVGFRRRYNSWYSGMTRQEIFVDTAKTAGKWLIFTALAYVYWLAILLMMSMFLLSIWHVQIAQILVYAGILCAACSVIYAYILVHRKFFY